MIPPGSSSITPRSSTFLSSPMALVLGAPSRGYKDTCCPIQASSLGSSVTAFSSPQSTCSILPERLSPGELGTVAPSIHRVAERSSSRQLSLLHPATHSPLVWQILLSKGAFQITFLALD